MGLIQPSRQERIAANAANSQSTPETGSTSNSPYPQNLRTKEQPETALAMEWQALDSEERRPDLFRKAGDEYLQANDVKSAVRCYKGALDGASDDELKVTVNDNWLLMSLKEAKLEEKRYAKLVRP